MILLNQSIPAELLRELNDQLSIFIDLGIEFIGEEDDSYLLMFFFERIVREDPDKCRLVLHELSQWAKDDWEHYLGYLHEYALDRVLRIAVDFWDDISECDNKELFFDGFFDEDYEDSDENYHNYLRRNIGNPRLYFEECFEDIDFIGAEERYRGLYEEGVLEQYKLSDDDLYFLPRDIRQEYLEATNRYRFEHLIDSMLSFLTAMLVNNKADQLLLNDDRTLRNENVIHILMEAILSPFCAANDLDIARESTAGGGLIDFKISRGSNAVLLEVKKFTGSISVITNAINHQLPAYMKAQNIYSGILVVLCFCNDDRLSTLQKELSTSRVSGIRLEVINLHRPRVAPSKLRS